MNDYTYSYNQIKPATVSPIASIKAMQKNKGVPNGVYGQSRNHVSNALTGKFTTRTLNAANRSDLKTLESQYQREQHQSSRQTPQMNPSRRPLTATTDCDNYNNQRKDILSGNGSSMSLNQQNQNIYGGVQKQISSLNLAGQLTPSQRGHQQIENNQMLAQKKPVMAKKLTSRNMNSMNKKPNNQITKVISQATKQHTINKNIMNKFNDNVKLNAQIKRIIDRKPTPLAENINRSPPNITQTKKPVMHKQINSGRPVIKASLQQNIHSALIQQSNCSNQSQGFSLKSARSNQWPNVVKPAARKIVTVRLRDVQQKSIAVQKVTRKNGSTEHYIQTSLSNSRNTSPNAYNMTKRSDYDYNQHNDTDPSDRDLNKSLSSNDNQVQRNLQGRTSPAQRTLMDLKQQQQSHYGQLKQRTSSRNLEGNQNGIRVNEFQLKTPTAARLITKPCPFTNTTNLIQKRPSNMIYPINEKQSTFTDFSSHFLATKVNQIKIAQKNIQGQGNQGSSNSTCKSRGVRSIKKLNALNPHIKTRQNNNEKQKVIINDYNASNPRKEKETYTQYMERVSPQRYTGSPRSNNSANRTKYVPTLSPKQGSGQGSAWQSPKRSAEKQQSHPSKSSSNQLNSAYLKMESGEKHQQSTGNLSAQSRTEKLRQIITETVTEINTKVGGPKQLSKRASKMSRNCMVAKDNKTEECPQVAQAYESQLRMYESKQNAEKLNTSPGSSEESQNTYTCANTNQYNKTPTYRALTANLGVTEATDDNSYERYSHPTNNIGPSLGGTKPPNHVMNQVQGKKQHKFLPFSESLEVTTGNVQTHVLEDDMNVTQSKAQHSHIFKKNENSSQNFRYADIHGASEMKDYNADDRDDYSPEFSKMHESPRTDKTLVLEQNFFEHTSPSPNSKTPPSGTQNETKANQEEVSRKVSEFNYRNTNVTNMTQTPVRGSNQPQFCSLKKGTNASDKLKQTIITQSSYAKESNSQYLPKSVIKSKVKNHKRLREIQQSKELRDSAINKAFELIHEAEKIEQNDTVSGKSRERSQASLSSNDSLIQTQRKLRKDYEEQKKSMNSGSFKSRNLPHGKQQQTSPGKSEFTEVIEEKYESEDKNRKTDSGLCLYDEDADVLNHEDIVIQGIKPKAGEENPFDLVKTPEKFINPSQNQDMDHTPPKKISRHCNLRSYESQSTNKKRIYLAKKRSLNIIENVQQAKSSKNRHESFAETQRNIEFPMQQFLSTTSQQEEDAILERYSQVVESKKKESSESFGSNKNSNSNPDGKGVYLNLDSQEKASRTSGQQNYKEYFQKNKLITQQIQQLKSKKIASQEPQYGKLTKKESNISAANENVCDQELYRTERQSLAKKPSVPIAVTQSLEKFKPFIAENRSPDSFVRISIQGPLVGATGDTPQKHVDASGQAYASRQSLASQSQMSVARRSCDMSQASGSHGSTVQFGESQPNSAKHPRRSRNHLNRVSIDSNGCYSEKSRTSLFQRRNTSELMDPASANKSSNKDSSLNQDSGCKKPKQDKMDTPTKKKPNQNIEINIEKIIQIEDQLQKMQKNFDFMAKKQQDDEDSIQSVIICCEEWWNIIREPTVSQQLIKCQKILSNLKIQINLKKSFVYQLILFTISGYLISCNQFQFNQQLSQISRLSHWNFLVLCHILVEKFPPQAIEKNIWANKLVKLLQNYSTFSQAIQQSFEGFNGDSQQYGVPGGSGSTSSFNIPREHKLQFLKMSNYKIQESLNSIIQASMEQRSNLLSDQVTSIYQHKIFDETKYIISNLDKSNENLAEYIERLGRSLRPDFDADEDEGDQDTNLSTDQTQMTMDDTQLQVPKGSGAQQRQASKDDEQVRLQQQFSANLRVQVDQGFQLIPAPYLPPKEANSKEYTLVLDLDETLLHFEEINENEGSLSIRPGADSFLKLMEKHFELVIFTAGTQEYADWALNFLENVQCISHRLYRQHALPFNGYYVKDLSRIGRDLSKTMIVDNIEENFQLQQYNGIFIKTWIQDPKDTCLFELAPFIIKMATSKCEDVRDILKVFQDSQDPILYSIAYGCMPPISQGPEIPKEEQDEVFAYGQANSNDDQLQRNRCSPIDEMTSSEESFSPTKAGNQDVIEFDENQGSIFDQNNKASSGYTLRGSQGAPKGFLCYQQNLTDSERKDQRLKIDELVSKSKDFEDQKVASKQDEQAKYESPEPAQRYDRAGDDFLSQVNDLEDDIHKGLSGSRQNFSDPRASQYNHDNGGQGLRKPRYEKFSNSEEPYAYDSPYIDNHSSSGGSGHTPNKYNESNPYTPAFHYGADNQDTKYQKHYYTNTKNNHTIYTIPESTNEFGSSIENGSNDQLNEQQFNLQNSGQSQVRLKRGKGSSSNSSNQNSDGSGHK